MRVRASFPRPTALRAVWALGAAGCLLAACAAPSEPPAEVERRSQRGALSALGAARASHTATALSQGALLVAGGTNGAAVLSSAELFNPDTGELSPTGAMQTARARHTALLLRTGEVLVAGGTGGTTPLPSAERYDPVSGSWQPAGALPAATADHTATQLQDGRVLIVGGTAGKVAFVYSPAAGSWSAAKPPLFARGSHTATLLPDGRVLVAGGAEGQTLARTAELFSPTTGEWTAAGSLLTARAEHTATLLPDGKVLVLGGRGAGGSLVATAELFDPVSGTWSDGGALAVARRLHSSVLLPSGWVLSLGGVDGAAAAISSAELHNPSTRSAVATAGLATASSQHTALLLRTGKVWVAGGQGTGGAVARMELLEGVAGSWSATPGSMAIGRMWHRTVTLRDGRVLVAGGYDGTNAPYATAEIFDPATGTFSPTNPMPGGGRESFTLTTLLDGRVLQVGGASAGPALSDASLYDPVAGTWTAVRPIPAARFEHVAVLLADGRVLVASGTTGNNDLTSAFAYDPGANSWTATQPMAVPHTAAAGVLLPNGKVLVAGGENNGGYANVAEVYDPVANSWSPTTNTFVGPRSDHMLTLLPNGKVLIAGGSTDTVFYASCFLYDPATNSWTATGSLSSPRWAFVQALLPSGRVLVAGGRPADNVNTTFPAAELYDPALGTWSPAPAMGSARGWLATIAPLPSGKLLVTGGQSAAAAPLATAEVFDEGASSPWAPTLDPPLPSLTAGSVHTVTGLGFTGLSQGEGTPHFILTRFSEGYDATSSVSYPRATSWTASQARVFFPATLQPGFYWLRVFVGGVPSAARVVQVTLPAAERLAFSSGVRVFAAGACPGAEKVLTVSLQTAAGAPASAGAAGVTFTLSSTSRGEVTWYTDANCTSVAPAGRFTLPAGASSVSVFYKDNQQGTPRLSLTNSSGLVDPPSQLHTVDGTPPTGGTVADGAGPDIDAQLATTGLSANWGGFVDLESGVVGYEWAIGTAAGGQDVQGFTPVGPLTEAVAGGVVLRAGTRYFVTVKATNGVGLTLLRTSDGIRAGTVATADGGDPTPPESGCAANGRQGTPALVLLLALLLAPLRRTRRAA